MSRRILRRLVGPLLLACFSPACSALLGLDPLEKVSCAQNCAGFGAGGELTAGGGAGDSGEGGMSGSAGEQPGDGIALVDDFADCDDKIIPTDGREGTWFTLATVSQSLSFGPPPNDTWKDKSCGVFLAGMCQTCGVNGIAVRLASPSYDLSRYSGLRFTYESESMLFVSVEATNGQSITYATSAAIAPSGGVTVATVLFATMNHDVDFQGFAHASAIQFRIADNNVGFGIGLHRLELLP